MPKKSLVIVMFLMLQLAAAEAQDATSILRAVSTAMGTATVRSIQYSGSGWNAAMGQSYMPTEDWPRFELASYLRVFDYQTRSSREEWTRVEKGTFSPRGGGASPLHDNKIWIQKFYASGGYAWNINGDAVSVTPRLTTSAGGLLPGIRQLDIWLSPHGFVKAALAAKDATALKLTLEGQPKTIVSFTTMDKYHVNGTIGADNLVERVQTWVQNPVFGDMLFEYAYSDYKSSGGVMVPGLIKAYQGDVRLNPGHSFAEIKVSNIQVNPNLPALTVPDKVRQAPPPGIRVASSQLAPGIWRVAGESHHSVAVEFRDFIAVVEAPQDEKRSLGVIAEVGKLIPGKPIRYVVNTHHHFDHSGGLRTYVAEGATIVTHAANKAFYENVLLRPAPWTLEPDLLSTRYPYFRADRMPLVEPVSKKYVISAGARMLDVYALQDVDESNMLVAYLPVEKILINADLYSPPAPGGPAPKNNTDTQQLYANIKRLKLTIERHVGIHGDVGSHQLFLKIVGADRQP